MKDFLQKDLEINDKVVACEGHGRNAGASLIKGIVIGFTEKFVRISVDSKITYYGNNTERLISPKKIVKLGD